MNDRQMRGFWEDGIFPALGQLQRIADALEILADDAMRRRETERAEIQARYDGMAQRWLEASNTFANLDRKAANRAFMSENDRDRWQQSELDGIELDRQMEEMTAAHPWLDRTRKNAAIDQINTKYADWDSADRAREGASV
jgi:hypothetical protein